MRLFAGIALAIIGPGLVTAQSAEGMFAQGAVAAVLDGFHAAAAAADEEKYFSYLAPGRRLPRHRRHRALDEGRVPQVGHPYFRARQGWTYRTTSRWIAFSPDRRLAWFDELLENASLGTCRGSGVLVATADGWRIEQYNLSIMVPNDAADAVVKTIAARPRRAEEKK
jgi:hypothetical protein